LTPNESLHKAWPWEGTHGIGGPAQMNFSGGTIGHYRALDSDDESVGRDKGATAVQEGRPSSICGRDISPLATVWYCKQED
jgi:hypothetical protein